jgi:hypothetical protein
LLFANFGVIVTVNPVSAKVLEILATVVEKVAFTTCNTPPDCGLAVESKVPVLEGKVSVAVTASVGRQTAVAPEVEPFNTIEPIYIFLYALAKSPCNICLANNINSVAKSLLTNLPKMFFLAVNHNFSTPFVFSFIPPNTFYTRGVVSANSAVRKILSLICFS